MNKCLILFMFTFLLLSSCANLLTNRAFIKQMERESEGFFIPGQQFSVVPGDSGYASRSREEVLKRTPASIFKGSLGSDRNNLFSSYSLKEELEYKESLLGMGEYDIYRENIDIFPTNSEKIYYLDLSREERSGYLGLLKKRYFNRESDFRPYSAPYQRSDRENFISAERADADLDLRMGMQKNDVLREWGRPTKINIAGNPRLENEKWAFYSQNGVSYIYFESGKVQGWSIP